MTVVEAIVIAIVEGITEFLPISSTGHMIIAQHLLGTEINEFTKAFTVNIQFGAILSVVVVYFRRFFQTPNFYYKLFVAFLPAAILGFLFNNLIDSLLENVMVVALMLLIGGVVLVYIDRWLPGGDKEGPTYKNALIIGLFQCLAMIPGVSRSAATIIGGLQQKLTRSVAAEFSFFLAVPTMAATSAFKLLKDYHHFNSHNLHLLLIGNVVAFAVAMLAIRFFIAFLKEYGFRWFGYYRIVVGAILLFLIAAGIDLKIA